MTTQLLTWCRSSHSDDGNCVEVAWAGAVLVRDSKDPHGPILLFDIQEWRSFVADLRIDGIDRSAEI